MSDKDTTALADRLDKAGRNTGNTHGYCEKSWLREAAAMLRTIPELQAKVEELEAENDLMAAHLVDMTRELDQLKTALRELQAKGESLCNQNADLMVKNHKLQARVDAIQAETVGYMWALACSMLDDGEDIRQVELPEIWAKAKAALQENSDD